MGKNVKKLNLTVKQAIENYVKGIKEVLNKSPKESIIILETGLVKVQKFAQVYFN